MPDAGQFQPAINAAATQYGIDPNWLSRLLYQENRFRPQGTSSAGAQGFAQFMPATAKQYGVNVNDPYSSIQGAAHLLSDNLKLFGGNQGLATAAYNWGPGNVQNWMKKGGAIPAETQSYVSSITGRPMGDWRGAGGTGARLATTAQPTTPGVTLNTTGGSSGAPAAVAGGPAAPAAPGQPGQAGGGAAPFLPGYQPGSPAAKMAEGALKKAAGGDAGGGGGGEDQTPQPPPPMQLNAQAAGGPMMMGPGGQNTFGVRAAQQALMQQGALQGFMTQPSLAYGGGNAMPSPIGAPSPGGQAPGSASGVPSMPGTTLNSPSQLQMALMTGAMSPYDLYTQTAAGS